MAEQKQTMAASLAPYAFGVLTLVLVFGVLFLVKGFLHALILGIIGATMLMPLHRRILKLTKYVIRKCYKVRKAMPGMKHGKVRGIAQKILATEKRLAAFCSVVLVFFCVVIPLAFFLLTVIKQGEKTLHDGRKWLVKEEDGTTRLYKRLTSLDEKYKISQRYAGMKASLRVFMPEELVEAGKEEDQGMTEAENAAAESSVPTGNTAVDDTVQPAPAVDTAVGETAKTLSAGDSELPQIAGKLIENIQNVWASLMRSVLQFIKQTWMLVVNFFIMLLVMFFAFRDGPIFVKYIRDISPFSDTVQEMMLERVSEVSRAVLYGILGTALVQSVVAMIVFRIVGIPALLWGSLLGMCSLIPFVGTSMVWVPVTVYFLVIGDWGRALVVCVGCGGIVANVDNFMRPAFICGGRTGMSYIVLFCSLLGGLQAFGLAGVVYGPLISGLCALCFYIFGTHYKMRNME